MSKICKIVPAQVERYTMKKGWFVTRYRITDMADQDLVQPWSKTKKEAKKLAKDLGYKIYETD